MPKHISKTASHQMLSKSGNPGLKRLTAILNAAGLRLAVRPVEHAE